LDYQYRNYYVDSLCKNVLFTKHKQNVIVVTCLLKVCLEILLLLWIILNQIINGKSKKYASALVMARLVIITLINYSLHCFGAPQCKRECRRGGEEFTIGWTWFQTQMSFVQRGVKFTYTKSNTRVYIYNLGEGAGGEDEKEERERDVKCPLSSPPLPQPLSHHPHSSQ
jgi:hypothetical protein